MAHFNNFGCYLIEVNLDDQSLFRLVLALASGISTSLGLLVTFRQHELHSPMHFSAHLTSWTCENTLLTLYILEVLSVARNLVILSRMKHSLVYFGVVI